MKKILVFSFIITLATSCIGPEPEDVDITTYSYLKNESGVNIELIVFNKSEIIQTPVNISILNNEYKEVYLWGCDSTKIVFNQQKVVVYTDTFTNKNPLNQDYYTQNRDIPNTIKYIYTITEQDYLDADTIK